MHTTKSPQTTKTIVHRLFAEFFNEGNPATADQLVSPNFVGPTGKGSEGFKATIAPLRQGFPDLHFTVEDTIADGSRVVVRWTSKGTHRGSFAGVAPTGREVFNAGIGIYRVENEKIVETWSQVDRLGVLQQIGALPPAGLGGVPPKGDKS
jgi:steroid delta-isomerase-like uncharacterized protein